jgi:ATP-binding cassette subfamily C protein CydD
MSSVEVKSIKELRAEEKHRLEWLHYRTRNLRSWVWGCVALGGLNTFLLVVQASILARMLASVIGDGRLIADHPGEIAGLILIYVLRALCTMISERTGVETASRLKTELRHDLMRRLVELGPAFTKTRRTGELVSVAVEQIEALDGYLGKYLPQKTLAVAAPLIIMFSILPTNAMAGAGLLLGGALVPVVMAIVGIGAATAARRQMRELSRMSGYFLDRLTGLPTLRLFGQARRELALVSEVAERFRGGTMRILRIAFLSSAGLELFSTAAVAGMAIYVGTGMAGLHDLGGADTLTLADGLFILILAPEFFLPLRQLSLHYHDRSSALASAEAILNILRFKPEDELDDADSTPSPLQAAPALAVEDLRLTHGGGARVALDRVDLALAPGECVALVGTSGAGKTSLMQILMGFIPPTEGRLLLNGAPVPGSQIRAHAAWVGQNTRLFHGSLADNIALGRPDAGEDEIRAAASAAGLDQVIADLPDGMASMVGELGNGISGGEAQRVALARAFLKDARLLLLDEPTASLDQDNEAAVLQALTAMRAGRTILIATHSPAVMAICDRTIHLSQGRVIAPDVGGDDG